MTYNELNTIAKKCGYNLEFDDKTLILTPYTGPYPCIEIALLFLGHIEIIGAQDIDNRLLKSALDLAGTGILERGAQPYE